MVENGQLWVYRLEIFLYPSHRFSDWNRIGTFSKLSHEVKKEKETIEKGHPTLSVSAGKTKSFVTRIFEF